MFLFLIPHLSFSLPSSPSKHTSGWYLFPAHQSPYSGPESCFQQAVSPSRACRGKAATASDPWEIYSQLGAPMWRRQWQPTPVLLPGKSHGWRSLVGCSPWDCQESDMTERLHFHFSLSCIGEGNGNPLQRSCLENPRDGGAWWAAISGVTQRWTRLK